MKNKFTDLIDQTYYFPQDGFDLRNGYLHFHGVSIKHLIEEHGTPFKLMYLPKIGDQIKRANNWFKKAMRNMAIKANIIIATALNVVIFNTLSARPWIMGLIWRLLLALTLI